MAKETFRFKVFSLRNIENPFGKAKGFKSYECIVNVEELPDLENWRQINVRDPKLRGSVPTKISQSLYSNPDLFLFMNRGILISTESVLFDAKSSEVTIELNNTGIHGIGDGGHTYSIIKREVSKLPHDQFVKLELLEGFSLQDIAEIVEGRNTSNQVKDESIMELTGKFELLKRKLPQRIIDRIAFSEYETDENGDPKPVSIREIVAILTAFDKDHYTDTLQPVIAYSGKSACLTKFKENSSSYEKLYNLAEDILKLHDYIYDSLAPLYNDSAKQNGKSSGRLGNVTGVTVNKDESKGPELHFIGKRAKYTIPSGFVYPILAAFRAFLEEEDGKYIWGKRINPVDVLKGDLGTRLAGFVRDEALKNQNPNKTGKSVLLWQTCYQNAELFYLKMK